jgi:hypothetical protein
MYSFPLLIVQGLMWVDSVGFFFLARLSVAPAVRFLFLVGGWGGTLPRCWPVDGCYLAH